MKILLFKTEFTIQWISYASTWGQTLKTVSIYVEFACNLLCATYVITFRRLLFKLFLLKS